LSHGVRAAWELKNVFVAAAREWNHSFPNVNCARALAYAASAKEAERGRNRYHVDIARMRVK
jgi:hypothetical protein